MVDPGTRKPVQVRTSVRFRETTVGLPTLGLTTEGTTGELVVEDGVVTLEKVEVLHQGKEPVSATP